MAPKAAVASEFLLGLADMLGFLGKKGSADTLTRAASRAPSQSTGLIGTRNPLSEPLPSRAPIPEFGPAGGPLGRIPLAQESRLGINRQLADDLQETSPELANIIRLNQDIAEETAAGAYNYQPSLGLRFPAGATNLTETISTTGRITPPGTKIGGRPYTPESMASPANVTTTRLAGTERLVDMPDAPARIPDGQLELDMRPLDQVIKDSAVTRTAPSIPSPAARNQAGVLVDDGRMLGYRTADGTNVMFDAPDQSAGLASRLGVQLTDLSDVVPAVIRNNPGKAAKVAGVVGLGGLIASRYTPEAQEYYRNRPQPGERPVEEAVLEQEAQPSSDPIVPPVVPPLDSQGVVDYVAPDTGVDSGSAFVEPPPSAQQTQASLTPEENASLRNLQSSTTEALAQSDPTAARVNNALAPRDPSYYTPERGGIARYYQDREDYVRSMTDGRIKELADRVEEEAATEDSDADLRAWATANPALAYELVNRLTNASPQMNQQSGQQLTSQALGSALGTNNAANAQGQAEAAGRQALAGAMGTRSPLEIASEIQKNNELVDAAQPIQYPRLQKSREFAAEAVARIRAGLA